MLVEELSIWKCFYCESINDHTNHRCYNCNKKKPSKSILKRLITLKKKKEKTLSVEVKAEQIKKLEPVPEPSDIHLNFDLSKLILPTDK